MKGLQGERLRQAFKYLDTDEDGFIKPEEFKRIILVRFYTRLQLFCPVLSLHLFRKLLDINYLLLL